MTEIRLNDRGVYEIWTDKNSVSNYMKKHNGGSWEFELAIRRAWKLENTVYFYKQAYIKMD